MTTSPRPRRRRLPRHRLRPAHIRSTPRPAHIRSTPRPAGSLLALALLLARWLYDATVAFLDPGRAGHHRRPLPPATRAVRLGSAAASALVLLSFAVTASTDAPGTGPNLGEQVGATDRAAQADQPSRSLARGEAEAPQPPEPAADAPAEHPAPSEPEPEPTGEPEPNGEPAADGEPDSGGDPEGPPEAEPEPEPEPKPEPVPEPVGGLSERQMEHATTIVRVGQELGLPERAYVVALATAMQESTLRVLASPAWPESFDIPNDGTGYDHDSVGLFQQRPSKGWGTVAECMDPETSSRIFYSALGRVPNWQDLPVTVAAQRVQVSAFPDHYAKHEPLARQVVEALT